jgi:hypothetical protein
MNEEAKKTAENIQKKFDKLQQGGLLVKELTKLKNVIMAIFRDVRRKRWDVETLIPEVTRIEKTMEIAENNR